MPSVTCLLRLSDVSVVCCVTYFQFPIHSAFPYRLPGSTVVYVVYPISDIGRCRKFGKYVFCMPRTAQGNDVELILTVKVESRHPLEGYFCNEFWVICNHC